MKPIYLFAVAIAVILAILAIDVFSWIQLTASCAPFSSSCNVLSAEPKIGSAPLPVTFFIDSKPFAFDPGGPLWLDFGDGTNELLVCERAESCEIPKIEHTYKLPGTYTANLVDREETTTRNFVIGTASITLK